MPGQRGMKQPTWWERQKAADKEFQAALRAAGVPEGVCKEPGTENPRFVEVPRQKIKSRSWFV